MTVVYRDPDPFGNGPHTIAEIAQALRTKQHGKDVREAMAQGFENIDDQINNQDTGVSKDDLAGEIKQVNGRIDHIVLGTDHDTVKQVVEQILKDKGVI